MGASAPTKPQPAQVSVSRSSSSPEFKKIILLGLSGSGKTTFVQQVKMQTNPQGGVLPPASTSMRESYTLPLYRVQLFDMAATPEARMNWCVDAKYKDGILFFIDMTMPSDIETVTELKSLLREVIRFKSPDSILRVVFTKKDLLGIKTLQLYHREWALDQQILGEINCLQHAQCHEILREMTNLIYAHVKEYKPPTPTRPLTETLKDLESQETLSQSSGRGWCECLIGR